MKRRILSSIMALTMAMSIWCSSASAFTPNLSAKANQWQTAKPVSSEFIMEERSLVFPEQKMKEKIAKELGKKVEELKFIDLNDSKELLEVPEGVRKAKNGGKMVKVDKKVLMESDLVKMGGTYYYKFKEVVVNNTPMLSMSILTLSGSIAETGIESPRPMSYKLDKTGNYTGIGYINYTSDKIPPIISECMLVTGTEYKYYAPVKDAIISNVIERKYTARNPVDHVAYMQIIG